MYCLVLFYSKRLINIKNAFFRADLSDSNRHILVNLIVFASGLAVSIVDKAIPAPNFAKF